MLTDKMATHTLIIRDSFTTDRAKDLSFWIYRMCVLFVFDSTLWNGTQSKMVNDALFVLIVPFTEKALVKSRLMVFLT